MVEEMLPAGPSSNLFEVLVTACPDLARMVLLELDCKSLEIVVDDSVTIQAFLTMEFWKERIARRIDLQGHDESTPENTRLLLSDCCKNGYTRHVRAIGEIYAKLVLDRRTLKTLLSCFEGLDSVKSRCLRNSMEELKRVVVNFTETLATQVTRTVMGSLALDYLLKLITPHCKIKVVKLLSNEQLISLLDTILTSLEQSGQDMPAYVNYLLLTPSRTLPLDKLMSTRKFMFYLPATRQSYEIFLSNYLKLGSEEAKLIYRLNLSHGPQFYSNLVTHVPKCRYVKAWIELGFCSDNLVGWRKCRVEVLDANIITLARGVVENKPGALVEFNSRLGCDDGKIETFCCTSNQNRFKPLFPPEASIELKAFKLYQIKYEVNFRNRVTYYDSKSLATNFIDNLNIDSKYVDRVEESEYIDNDECPIYSDDLSLEASEPTYI
jgi:hypothetical protein